MHPPPANCTFDTVPNLVVLDQTVPEYVRMFADLRGPSRPAFRVSRLEVAGTDTDRPATYDFLLAIRSNCGPYRFGDKRRFRSKIEIFPYSRFLTLSLKWFPLEFCNGGGVCPQTVEKVRPCSFV